jgi:hypothetical protein
MIGPSCRGRSRSGSTKLAETSESSLKPLKLGSGSRRSEANPRWRDLNSMFTGRSQHFLRVVHGTVGIRPRPKGAPTRIPRISWTSGPGDVRSEALNGWLTSWRLSPQNSSRPTLGADAGDERRFRGLAIVRRLGGRSPRSNQTGEARTRLHPDNGQEASEPKPDRRYRGPSRIATSMALSRRMTSASSRRATTSSKRRTSRSSAGLRWLVQFNSGRPAGSRTRIIGDEG